MFTSNSKDEIDASSPPFYVSVHRFRVHTRVKDRDKIEDPKSS